MSRILLRKNPSHFKTLPIAVEASPERLCYQPQSQPLNFSQMLERRRPVAVENGEHFSLQLANLGVSTRITLSWRGREYGVLVRQRRADREDTVLKLVSGYVPTQEMALPLQTAIQEITEECLPETPEGFLSGRYDDIGLPTPYADSLSYREGARYHLRLLSGAARPVFCGHLPLMERPRAYVHQPTASLQLVYDLHLEIPTSAHQLTLHHLDESLEEDALIVRLERQKPTLYLLPLDSERQPTGELLRLRKGELESVSTRGIWLSESFAPQEGWVIRAQRISWKDWAATRLGK